MIAGANNLAPYAELARPDQWLKNLSILPGLIVALFFRPELGATDFWGVGLTAVAACLVSSSNYVLNGILDASSDRAHPTKLTRPLPAGSARFGVAWAEWVVLGAVGVTVAFGVNRQVGWTAVIFLASALVYNLPPLRAKDLPYLDVLVEAFNNPLRLMLGWFILIPDRMPPLSLLVAYWGLGAFLLAVKRVAELRFLKRRGSPAAVYRSSFAHYSEERLLASTVFHLVLCSFFSAVFIVRFKLELILILPAAALFLAYYLWLGLREESPAQNPEKIFRRPTVMGYLAGCLLLFILLVHTHIPALYRVFNVAPASTRALWEIGR